MPRNIIGPIQADFLLFELTNGDALRKKNALQELAKQYRQQCVLTSEKRNLFEHAICGLVLQRGQNYKVVRWCLNCIAQLGRRDSSAEYVELALKQHQEIPEIAAAGVAALCKMHSGGRIDEIDALNGIDPKIRTLAALQNTHPKFLDLQGFRINIEKDDDEVLKLALITVGLNRDIENLFDPRHPNGEIVRILGQHSDRIVVQYSVWAIMENKTLSINNLGIQIDQIDKLPPNVQSKALQLVAEMEPDFKRRHRIIADGQFSSSAEARVGLAKGIRFNYYDGLEEITLEWFDQETHEPVRELLSEHFSANAHACSPYEDRAIKIFDSDPSLQSRLLLGSEGHPLYGKLKAKDVRTGTADMFGNISDEIAARVHELSTREDKKKEKVILMLSASPLDEARIRIDAECRDIQEKLQLVTNPEVSVNMRFKMAVRTDQIQEAILNEKPEILHFSGHGGGGFLCFEDHNGNAALVSGEALSELVTLNRDCIKCVILSACYSKEIGELLKDNVECVIGCDGSINDEASLAFSRSFYRAIANGRSYHDAFKFAQNEIRLVGMESDADIYVCL